MDDGADATPRPAVAVLAGDSRYFRFVEGEPDVKDIVFTQLVAGGDGREEWVTLGARARKAAAARGPLRATLVARTGGRTTDTRAFTLVGVK